MEHPDGEPEPSGEDSGLSRPMEHPDGEPEPNGEDSTYAPSARQLRDETATKLKGPAIALAVYYGFASLLLLSAGVLGAAGKALGVEQENLLGNLVMLGLWFVLMVLGFVGSIAMYRTKGYGLAVASVVLAWAPCCLPFSLPGAAFGIWAALTLFKGATPYVFRGESPPLEVSRRAAINASSNSSSVTWIIVLSAVGAVVLLGFLLAVPLALYGVRRYLLTTKTHEAKEGVRRLAQDMTDCYQARGSLPPTTYAVPEDAELIRQSKYKPDPGDWDQDAFNCAGFSLVEPHYYQYQWVLEADGNRGYAVARGDLDGDGKLSEFRLYVRCTDQCRVAPDITERDPLE